MEKSGMVISKKILKNIAVVISAMVTVFCIVFGLAGCSTSAKYELKYLKETPIYSTLGDEVGVIVEAEVKIKKQENGVNFTFVKISATKLLYHTYTSFPDEELTYHYGKVDSVKVNLLDSNYPTNSKHPRFNLVGDICEIEIFDLPGEKLTLSIIYIYDSSLTKTFNSRTNDWQ